MVVQNLVDLDASLLKFRI
jgi:hypothetical protein